MFWDMFRDMLQDMFWDMFRDVSKCLHRHSSDLHRLIGATRCSVASALKAGRKSIGEWGDAERAAGARKRHRRHLALAVAGSLILLLKLILRHERVLVEGD